MDIAVETMDFIPLKQECIEKDEDIKPFKKV